jgi:hypothetical protein
MSKLFSIHGPVSVVTIKDIYPEVAFKYAKYLANKEDMDYLIISYANETTAYSKFENKILYYSDSDKTYARSHIVKVGH